MADMLQLTPDQITQATRDHEDEARYGAQGDVTKCNLFVCDVIESLLAQSRPELHGLANQQFDALSQSSDWSRRNFPNDLAGGFQQANAAANNGTIVVVAYKNPDPAQSGHIAIVVPSGGLEQSGTWAMPVPFIAQAGRTNPRKLPAEANKSVFSSLKLSYGFQPQQAPNMEIFNFVG
jgi:hypothetical protein